MDRIHYIVAMLLTGIFLTLSLLLNFSYRDSRKETLYNMALSAKVLKYSLTDDSEIGKVEVDRNRLVKNYKRLLKQNNIKDEAVFNRFYSNIVAKVLVYPDYFAICNNQEEWSIDYRFNAVLADGRQIYFNLLNNDIYYYDDNNIQINTTLDTIGLNTKQKVDLSINMLNSYINSYTEGAGVKIRNPYNDDDSYKMTMDSFNILDGLTFFSVYNVQSKQIIWKLIYNFRECEIVGYTIDSYD